MQSSSSSSSFNLKILYRERTNLGFDQPLIILEGDLYAFAVRPGVENNIFVIGKTLIHIHRNIVNVAKGRHSAHFTVGKVTLPIKT